MPSLRSGLRPVEHLRRGDHAFVSYGNDCWEVLAPCVWLGLSRGERVMVLPDPARPRREVEHRLGEGDQAMGWACGSGQLVIGSITDIIVPDTASAATRQAGRLREETEQAVRDGYTGFRTVTDMAWVHELGTDIEAVMHRETHATALFANGRYTEICAYGRSQFTPEVVEAMRRGHPVTLVEPLGGLACLPGAAGLRVIGDADLYTRDKLTKALTDMFTENAGASSILLDLTGVCFLDVGCATALLALAEQAGDFRRIDILCGAFHADLLRRLGARDVRHLKLTVMAA